MPIKCHNRVLLLLACVAIAAVALPFVNVAPNRLVSGEPRALWQIWAFTPLLLGAALTAAVILLCALCYYHLTPAGHLPPEPWGGLPLGWIGGNHA